MGVRSLAYTCTRIHTPPGSVRVTSYRGLQGTGVAVGEEAIEALADDLGKCFPYHWGFPEIAGGRWCCASLPPTPGVSILQQSQGLGPERGPSSGFLCPLIHPDPGPVSRSLCWWHSVPWGNVSSPLLDYPLLEGRDLTYVIWASPLPHFPYLYTAQHILSVQ